MEPLVARADDARELANGNVIDTTFRVTQEPLDLSDLNQRPSKRGKPDCHLSRPGVENVDDRPITAEQANRSRNLRCKEGAGATRVDVTAEYGSKLRAQMRQVQLGCVTASKRVQQSCRHRDESRCGRAASLHERRVPHERQLAMHVSAGAGGRPCAV